MGSRLRYDARDTDLGEGQVLRCDPKEVVRRGWDWRYWVSDPFDADLTIPRAGFALAGARDAPAA
ncbi:MAG: hypothetical protein ACRDPA_06215 [Solirubrobacteraceae bacterium]